MSGITNWEELLNKVDQEKSFIFSKLASRIKQTLKFYQKFNENFDISTIQKNHLETFNNFKVLYEQLKIETDATDILVEIPSLSSKNTVVFNIISIGKWIKCHSGNANRIFFYDDEKTMISDKTLADFLNKIEGIRNKYNYFGKPPTIFYKFKIMPSNDVIKYFESFNVVPIEFDKPTPQNLLPMIIDNKVLLDQSMLLTLCSNLSFGLSSTFYSANDSTKENSDGKTKVIVMKNKLELDKYLENKILLVNQHVYDQTKFKMEKMAGPNEKERFNKLCERLMVVPDEKNPRFYYLKDTELLCVSTAERELAIIVTGNQRMCNKIDAYYSEMKYKLFIGAQLAEGKFP